ncbi:MAG TPA: DUF4097 family beta strand repeat-containing protein [Bryobacteraceae bacterium]|nr:DUF4097 family beta strand repeat-containing protein [Bryobacteraceae bacterium]
MKRLAALLGLTFSLCALAGAQQTTGDRVVVPARNSTHPRVVNAKVTRGTITVKTYTGNEVIVEADRASGKREAPDTYQGLKRIDLPRGGLEVTEEDNVVRVRTGEMHDGSLVITVPVDTSLQLSSTFGPITVDGVHGDIDASTTHDGITLTNVSGTVLANSTHGNIKVSMDRVDPGKPLNFATVHGDIDVALPADVKVNIKAITTQGSIYSDFEIKLTGGQPITEKNDTPDGKFRVRIDRAIYGAINGGGGEASLRTVHGRILLRKK